MSVSRIFVHASVRFPTASMTSEFLANKPLFAQVVDDFLEFIGNAPLVIHNA